MAIIDFIGRFFNGTNEITLQSCSVDSEYNNHYKNLIVGASIDLISKTVARAEFQTFEKGKESKKNNYYLFNVEANQNTSSYNFWKETVSKLLEDGEALIVIQNKKLYLADSFTRKEFVFKPNQYSEIKIGDYELSDVWMENKVIYLKDDNTSLSTAVNGLYEDYKKLLSASIKGYENSKSRKGTLKVPTNLPKTLQKEGELQKHIQASMKDFMDPAKDAIYPETNGFEYKEIAESKGSKSNDSGRETKNFINDVYDFVAVSFGIPTSLLKGDTVDTKDAVNNFLTFCINPIAKLISEELNRKMYGYEEYSKSTYVTVDTSRIKAVDIKDIANSLELLTRTGSNTIDDNLRALGREPIGGDIGSMRFVTKNLEWIEETLKNHKNNTAGGGD